MALLRAAGQRMGGSLRGLPQQLRHLADTRTLQPSSELDMPKSAETPTEHRNLQTVRELHDSNMGLIIRAITGCKANQNTVFRANSEVMKALALFNPRKTESASLLTSKAAIQKPFSEVIIALKNAEVSHVSNCDIGLRPKWDDAYVSSLPLAAKLFPGTAGRKALVETIAAKGKDKVSTRHKGDKPTVSEINELRIKYNPKDILLVGLHYSKENVQTRSQQLNAADIKKSYDMQKDINYTASGLVDDISTALFAKAALEEKTGLTFPIGCYDGKTFQEIEFPDDFLEVAKKQYEEHKSSFESLKMDFKNALKLFIKIFLVLYALKETIAHLSDLNAESSVSAEEVDDVETGTRTPADLIQNAFDHTVEGIEHLIEHLADPEVSGLDKAKAGARLAVEGFISYISLAPVFLKASFPLVALSSAAKTISFLGLLESEHGHDLHRAKQEAVTSPDLTDIKGTSDQ